MTEGIARIWRNQRDRYNLIGTHCEECKNDFFPQRKICPVCRRKGKLKEKQMPTTGKIYSFTLVTGGPVGFDYETPYHLAIVELDNKVKILTQIVDSDDDKIKIGQSVKAMFRRIQTHGEEGLIAYGYKFKVV